MKKIIVVIFLLTTSLLAKSINIAVAANVSYAIDRLKKEFELLHPDIKVDIILGSSGKLTAQIRYGAPYDLFMSADMRYPQNLYENGYTLTKPKTYAQGALAIISTKKRDFSLQLELLLSKNISKIAVANSKTAPYGIATKEALTNAKLYKKIQSKFIYGESVSQTLSYAVTAADFGFVAKSALYSPNLSNYKEGKNWISVNTSLYTPIKQGIILLKNSTNHKSATQFYNFILSERAKEIFQKFGYTIL